VQPDPELRTDQPPAAPVAPLPGSEAAPPPIEQPPPDSTDLLAPPPPLPEQSPYGPDPIESGPRNWMDEHGNNITDELFPR
jgi:hypothetical protein